MFLDLQIFFNFYSFVYRFIFFDSVCPFCGYFSLSYICQKCKQFFFNKINIRKLNPTVFEKDLKKVYFDNLYFLFSYSDFFDFIKHYKFENRIYLAGIIADFLYSTKDNDLWKDVDFITFIPNHRKISNFLICTLFSKKIKIEMKKLFSINSKSEKLQHLIDNKEERIKNAKDKFLLNNSIKLEHVKKIVIFDDVSTTGSSLNEASRLIKLHNKQITLECIVLAKG